MAFPRKFSPPPRTSSWRPQPMGDLMGQLIRDLGIETKVQQQQAVIRWPSVVGEAIGRATEADRLENGVLFVHVSSAPWRAELTMQKRQIIAKLNRSLGAEIVRDILFR